MKLIVNKLGLYFSGRWKIGIMNPEGGLWSEDPTLERIGYFKAMNAKGYHIFIKPEFEERFLLLDDLSREQIERQKEYDFFKPGRLVIETSPDNFQVWIKANRKISYTEKRYWIRKVRADSACDPNLRWGRCPGFRNRKEKYQGLYGEYPLARLVWVDWRYLAVVPTIYLPEPPKHSPENKINQKRSNGPINRMKYERGDESATDFAYALALLRRGASRGEVAQRLLNERNDWTHHHGERRKDAYIKRTITKAVEIINS